MLKCRCNRYTAQFAIAEVCDLTGPNGGCNLTPLAREENQK